MYIGSPPVRKHALASSTILSAPDPISWQGSQSAAHESAVSSPLHVPSPHSGGVASALRSASVPLNLLTSTVFAVMPGIVAVELYWWNAHRVHAGGTSGQVAL